MVTLSLRGLKLAVAALAVFAIAACAKTDQTAGIGAGGAGGAATLDKQAAWLARYPRYTFLVEGHADERGTREYNFSLGARRSQVVREYLQSRGITGSRMRSVSYGKERPVAVCNDISCWSQNRRAVTVLDGGVGS